MEQILYMPGVEQTLAEYRDAEELEQSYRSFGCAGLEIIRCDYGENSGTVTGVKEIVPDMIRGVHMIFYPCWLDFWNGDEEALLREFGSREVWEGFYRGKDRDALMRQFAADLDYAERVAAQYVVFHVSDVLTEGVFTHRHTHTDEEVVDAAADLINGLLDGRNFRPDFLMENLWWPGLTMTDPRMTRRLLDGVHYERKGIMLDTGHLMCSNMELRTEGEAVEYVSRMVEAHRGVRTKEGLPLTDYIKGIHLHQSVTGACARAELERVQREGLRLAEDYYDRFAQVYELLGRIDTHRPFSSPLVKGLAERIDPAYVVHELMAKDRKEREAMLAQQSRLL